MTSKHPSSMVFLMGISLVTNATAIITCHSPKEECIDGQQVRDIDNFPVELDCWRKRVIYACHAAVENNCQPLREQKCSQVGAQCKTIFNGTCVVQEATYQCPKQKCENIKIPCAKNIFCLEGDCVPISATKNNNFDQTVASLAAVAKAAQDMAKQNDRNSTIFAGRAMECSKNIISGVTKNCCGINASGFLEGVLLHCSDEEMELAKRKEQGTAIYIGKYCHNKVLRVCTSHHQAYCVFDSKIARIVQQEGRKGQLGIGFGHVGGDAANLDCRGITPDELASMDFKKMDFSPLYDDLKHNLKIPNVTDIGLKAAEKIKDFYSERTKK